MATYGFNFRGSIGGATDGPNETYVLGDGSSHTQNGITFQWTQWPAGSGGADRSATGDDRLKGINFLTPGNAATFTVTLPTTGAKNVRVALGDPWYGSWTDLTLSFYDNLTLLYTVGPVTPAAGYVYDANAAQYGRDAWGTANTPKRLTFGTTTMNVAISAGAGQYVTIAYLEVADASATPPVAANSAHPQQAVTRAAYW